jgi:hypothetical protein
VEAVGYQITYDFWHDTKFETQSNPANVMNDPKEKLRDSVKILNDYYGILATQIAEEIIERKEDFTSGEDFTAADKVDDILEKYAQQINRLGTVYGMLRGEAWSKKSAGTEPLAPSEFRCFGCGGLIGSNDQACPSCGWSWK